MGQGMKGERGGLWEGGGERKEERTLLFSRPFIIFLLCPLFCTFTKTTRFTVLSLLRLDSDHSVPGVMHLIYKTGVTA